MGTGAGYPDISLLKPLADILGTNVNELLEGEASGNSNVPEMNLVEKALNYADKIITIKENNIGKIINSALSILVLIAICASVIVNVAVNHRLSWSLLVIDGCFMGCFLFIPLLKMKKRGLLVSLCFLTIFIIPFLAVIEFVTSGSVKTSGWLWGIGVPISVTWLVVIWLLVLFYRKIKMSIWFYIGIGLLLCIPAQVITNHTVDIFTDFAVSDVSRSISNFSTVFCLIAVSGICFIIGFNKRKSNKEKLKGSI